MSNRFIAAVGRHHIAMAIVIVAYKVPLMVIPRWGEAWLDLFVLMFGLLFLLGYGVWLGWRCSTGHPWWRRLGAIAAVWGLSWLTTYVLISLYSRLAKA